MQVTMLEAHLQDGAPMTKTYAPTGATAYPMARLFTSHTYEIDPGTQGLDRLAELLQQGSDKGWAMLRGNLTEKLVRESRKGKAKDENTHLLVLDLDGVQLPEYDSVHALPTPFTAFSLMSLAENAVNKLPEPLCSSSYIVQASASMGMKGNKLSMHLFFLMPTAVSPRTLKDYLIHLNFECLVYEQQLRLTASGVALGYPVDPTMAEKSRIIYIAAPKFVGVADPFANPKDRIVKVTKANELLNLAPVLANLNTAKLAREVDSKLKDLRRINGLSPKKQKFSSIRHLGEVIDVVNNPDKMTLHVVADEGQYVRMNVNNGDSNAYYVDKRNPNIVWNFKGEAPFLLSAADPEMHTTMRSESKEFLKDRSLIEDIPFAFRDMESDTLYAGLMDPQTRKASRIHKITNTNLEGFFADFGHAVPEIIPQVDYRFDPTLPEELDLEGRFVNRWICAPLLSSPITLEPQFQNTKYGLAAFTLETLCPTIHKIMWSVCGNGEAEYEHFINWLAYVVQKRRKTLTTWIFHGVEGTGKGLLFNQVLTPILGRQYCERKTLQNLADGFNSWIEGSLLVMVDEFRIGDARNVGEMEDLIKGLITEEHTTVRGMRQDQRQIRSFTNYIFTSNNHDAMRISENDRRWNVCPPQETKLAARYPELFVDDTTAIELIQSELETFAQFLRTYDLDERAAHTCLETAAKTSMREVARTTVEDFCYNIRKGNLDYLTPILSMSGITPDEIELMIPAQRELKLLLQEIHASKDHRIAVGASALRAIYMAFQGGQISQQKFGKMMAHHGLSATVMKKNGEMFRGYHIKWHVKDDDLSDLLKLYVKEICEMPKTH